MNKTLVALTLLLATSYAWITADVTLDSSTTLSSSVGIQVYGTANDLIGASVANAGDFNNDGYQDFLIGTTAAKAFLVFGSSSARTAALNLGASANAKSVVLTFSFAGTGATGAKQVIVSAAGDMNKDGYDDIALGLPNYSPTAASDVGIVAVYYGKSTADVTAGSGSITLDVDTDVTSATTTHFYIRYATPAAGDASKLLGSSIASVGDMSGNDGAEDLLVGAPGVGTNLGAAYFIYGRAKTGTPLQNARNSDVALGALTTPEGVIIAGITGEAIKLGTSVAGLQDINGDDIPDAIIGATGKGTALGYAFIIYGKTSAFTAPTLGLSQPGSSPTFSVISGATNDDFFGFDVGTAGDLNGDGEQDYFIGAPKAGTTNTGKVFVLWGKAASGGVRADLQVTDANMVAANSNGIIITGAAVSGFLGTNSDGGADVNRDQVDDLIMCAPFVDYVGTPSLGTSVGKCYVLYGKTTIATQTLPPASGAGITITGIQATGFGRSVSVVGDVNNDSGDDFVIGAPSGASPATPPVTTTGSVYEFHGVGVNPTKSGFRLGASLLVFVSFFAALLF